MRIHVTYHGSPATIAVFLDRLVAEGGQGVIQQQALRAVELVVDDKKIDWGGRLYVAANGGEAEALAEFVRTKQGTHAFDIEERADDVAPPLSQSSAPSESADPVAAFGADRLIAVLAAAVAAIGSVGPWATVSAGVFSFTANGMDDGRDGIVTFIGAALAIVLILVRRPTGAAVFGGLVTALAVWDLFDIGRVAGDAASEDVRVTAGWGIWLVAIGGFGCFLASLAVRRRFRRARGDARPSKAQRLASRQWVPDPYGRHDHRYFDGNQWTDRVADAGAESIDPAGYAVPTEPVEGWAADPFGRFPKRYYRAGAWTEYVTREGTTYTDPALHSPPNSAPPRPPAP